VNSGGNFGNYRDPNSISVLLSTPNLMGNQRWLTELEKNLLEMLLFLINHRNG